MILAADSEDRDQTHSLIWVFPVHACPEGMISFRFQINIEIPRKGNNHVPQLSQASEKGKLTIKKSTVKSPLRKHAFSNTMKISPPKTENFQIKNFDIFLISAQNIDCGHSLETSRRGGSNVYPQSLFLRRNKKNNVYPCKPQFYYIKVGFKGVNII